MKIQAEYSAKAVIKAIEARQKVLKIELEESNKAYENTQKPIIRKLFLGLTITLEPDAFAGWHENFDMIRTQKILDTYDSKLGALRKVKAETKIFLTYQEINILMNTPAA